ncbi:hypothetical protein SLH49_21305 [Cognatiyoonia sp. IB215446]|uniref:hypothetical protein n=1 Tax=Cognatiyoonia sp. IB215446 TaxID=3097355 RepID=UPI002A125810|nr:hypothetical protein [Cognatiyoonia sp. IB215446]MDX8350535.1 hypothetical protein [Cognatiyoonia sp. IB215446]
MLLTFTLFCFPSYADEHAQGSIRIPGYDTAGFVGDLNASRFFSAMSLVASAIPNDNPDKVLLLLFIGEGIIKDDRIAEFGLQGFSDEQANALAELEVADEQCNLVRLDSELEHEVHLLAIDTALATEQDLHRCIAVLLAVSRGVPSQRARTLTNQQLIVEFFESF